MHKPLHVSGHYNWDFNPKPPISSGNFTTRLRTSMHWVFQQDALNTKVTQENISNYSECITKASGSRLPIASQSLGCCSGFSLPIQFCRANTWCSFTKCNTWPGKFDFDIRIKTLVLSYRVFHKFSNRTQRTLNPRQDLFFLVSQLKVPWDTSPRCIQLNKREVVLN